MITLRDLKNQTKLVHALERRLVECYMSDYERVYESHKKEKIKLQAMDAQYYFGLSVSEQK